MHIRLGSKFEKIQNRHRYIERMKRWKPAPHPFLVILFQPTLLYLYFCLANPPPRDPDQERPLLLFPSQDALESPPLPEIKRPAPPFHGRWYGMGRVGSDGEAKLAKPLLPDLYLADSTVTEVTDCGLGQITCRLWQVGNIWMRSTLSR